MRDAVNEAVAEEKLRLLEEGEECRVDDETLGLGLPALEEALEE